MELIILVGIPGSGKSTLTDSLSGKVVSTDSMRKNFFGDETMVKHDTFVLKIARKNKAKIRIIWVDTPIEVALKRNADRALVVPWEIIIWLYNSLEQPTLIEDVDIIEIRDENMKIKEILKKDEG